MTVHNEVLGTLSFMFRVMHNGNDVSIMKREVLEECFLREGKGNVVRSSGLQRVITGKLISCRSDVQCSGVF